MSPFKFKFPDQITHLLKSDFAGVAIEFALLVPLVMIPLYVGMVDLTTGYMAKTKLALALNQTANVIAQYDTMTVANMNTILVAGDSTIYPMQTSNFTARHSLLNLTNSGNTVVWSYGDNPRPVGEAVTVEPEIRNLFIDGFLQNVLFSEGNYTYNVTIASFLSAAGLSPTYNLTEQYYTRPRVGETINVTP